MSKYIPNFWSGSKQELVRILTGEEQFQLCQVEQALVKLNLTFTEQIRAFKECHYGCHALFESSEVQQGAQIYCRKLHESNRCAESLPLAIAQKSLRMGKPDPMATLIVHHANFDRHGNVIGPPVLAAPCHSCLRLLEQVSSECLIVIDVDGQNGEGRLVKAPTEVCWQYFAHARKHKGE